MLYSLSTIKISLDILQNLSEVSQGTDVYNTRCLI